MGAPSHSRRSVGMSRVWAESESLNARFRHALTGPTERLANAKASVEWATAPCQSVELNTRTINDERYLGYLLLSNLRLLRCSQRRRLL